MGQLAGAAEVQQMLGVSRKRAYELSRRSDFPSPLEELAMGPVWAVPDIRAWAERTHRTLCITPNVHLAGTSNKTTQVTAGQPSRTDR